MITVVKHKKKIISNISKTNTCLLSNKQCENSTTKSSDKPISLYTNSVNDKIYLSDDELNELKNIFDDDNDIYDNNNIYDDDNDIYDEDDKFNDSRYELYNVAETIPAETIPAETIPAETIPAETIPVETIPAETYIVKFDPFSDDILEQSLFKYPIPLFDKISGLIYGAAIGECLGNQFNNISECDMLERYPNGVLDMSNNDMHGIHHNDWGCNVDQMVLILDVLSENNIKFDISRFVKKLKLWKNKGFHELGDIIGNGIDQHTSCVVTKNYFTKDPIRASKDTYRELNYNVKSNGALIRGTILGICDKWQSIVVFQTVATHINSLCIYSSWLITSICRSLIKGELPVVNQLLKNKVAFIKKHAKLFNEYQYIYECKFNITNLSCDDILNIQLDKLQLGVVTNMNYVLKSLGCAFYALNVITCVAQKKNTQFNYANMFKTSLLNIVNKGGNTSVNTAAASVVFGSWLGYKNLPKQWVTRFKNKRWLDKKITTLFKTIIKRQ
jgi:ADP-ribosylglycohydrolase